MPCNLSLHTPGMGNGMSTSVTFRCDGCEQSAVIGDDDRTMPDGWRFVRPEGVPLLMCATCAPPEGRSLAMTPELCQRLARRGIHLNMCSTLWGIGTKPDRRRGNAVAT